MYFTQFTLQSCVCLGSLAAGLYCLFLYQAALKAAQANNKTLTEHAQEIRPNGAALTAGTISDLTKFAEALAKIADSVQKAGPGALSMLAAVLFFTIAAAASGVLQAPADKSEVHKSEVHKPEVPKPEVSKPEVPKKVSGDDAGSGSSVESASTSS